MYGPPKEGSEVTGSRGQDSPPAAMRLRPTDLYGGEHERTRSVRGPSCRSGPRHGAGRLWRRSRSPASSSSPPADRGVVFRQFAQCVRDHGDPSFPDPTVDAQGNPQLPDGVQKPASAVMQACGSILNQVPAQNRSDQPDPAAMRRFAQCMRDHGVSDWPDPDAEGYFHFPPELANFKASPRWPEIHAAWMGPCKRFNPQGHVWGA